MKLVNEKGEIDVIETYPMWKAVVIVLHKTYVNNSNGENHGFEFLVF